MNVCHFGDCRDIMRRLIAEGVKVQMCVTSPPYWGLRDYGTATWEGGDAACDHLRPRLGGHGDKSPIHGSGHASDEASQIQQWREVCRKRSVWNIPTSPYPDAHFATFPPDLIEPCILAGSKPGDIVLDPFFGSGTTGEVAQNLGRSWIGCELNPEYEPLQKRRTEQLGMVLA